VERIVAVGLAIVFAVMAAGGTALAAAKAAPTSKVNVNTATAEQFAALPGVGLKLEPASSTIGRSPAAASSRCRSS
jgi:hypothetical protein